MAELKKVAEGGGVEARLRAIFPGWPGFTGPKTRTELKGPCPLCGGEDRFWVNLKDDLLGCRGCPPRTWGKVDYILTHPPGGQRPYPPPSSSKRVNSEAEATDLLQKRGLRPETIAHFQIVADIGEQAWRYPALGLDGNGRCRLKSFDSGRKPKYWWGEGDGTPPYNLRAAIDQKIVYLPGGEPNVWLMHQAGLPAVWTTGGEQNDPTSLLEELKSLRVAEVRLVLDNDDAGRAGSQKALQAARRVGLRARAYQLPNELGHKADIGDLYLWHRCDDAAFRQALQGLPELAILPAEAEASEPTGPGRLTAVELLAKDFPDIQWRVEGLVPDGSLTAIASRPKMGKTFLALQIAQAVAVGAPVLGRDTIKGKVLFLALEDGERRIQRRLKDQNCEPSEDLVFVFDLPNSLTLDTEEGIEALAALIRQEGPALVVIDTISGSRSGKFDERVADQAALTMNRLRRLAQELDIAILGIFHHGKLTSGDAILDLRGSSAIAAAVDNILGLYKDLGRPGCYTLSGGGRDLPEIGLRLTFDNLLTMCWQCEGDAGHLAATEAEEDILDILEGLGEADAKSIAKELGKARQVVAASLRLLEQKELATSRWDKTSSGSKKRVYSLTSLLHTIHT